ncbi:hypothetical protein G6541_32100, partial [Streptomyces albidoflavus]|nr:hypothetical protein [Streptomyces albidoflavus]
MPIPDSPARPASYRTVLAVPEFRALLLAQTLATCGTVVVQTTLSVLVYARTGSALLASLAFALGFTPYLFGATLLSAVADRCPARDVLVVCQALSCAVAAAMALPGLPVPVLLALVLVLGVAAPVFQGARAAACPTCCPTAATRWAVRCCAWSPSPPRSRASPSAVCSSSRSRRRTPCSPRPPGSRAPPCSCGTGRDHR